MDLSPTISHLVQAEIQFLLALIFFFLSTEFKKMHSVSLKLTEEVV